MKYLNTLFIAATAAAAAHAQLPEHFNPTKLTFPTISEGRELNMSIQVKIPPGQKLSRSYVDIYEQHNGQWTKTANVPIDVLFTAMNGNTIKFSHKQSLNSTTGPIAIDSSLYHCPAQKKGVCVIDNFQGIVQRTPKANSKTIDVNLQGTDPEKYKTPES